MAGPTQRRSVSLTEEAIRGKLASVGSLLEGHFVLTSGMHSDRYVQCAKVFEHPDVAGELCAELASRLAGRRAQVVLGPAYGGIILAYELARHLKARAVFVEREERVFALRRGFGLEAGERVLVAEDVVTTGGSAAEAAAVARRHGAEVCGMASLIDRSAGAVDGLTALVKLQAPAWKPEACPLCAEGVAAVKPGSRKSP